VKYDGVVLPAGTVDDNVIQALLPYFKWEPNASFRVSVFGSGKGTVQLVTYTVTGEETLTLPMGEVATYRVAFSGGESPGTFWIEKDPAHRVMKFGPAGQPIEFVRAR
jgi:hypothetical protein